MNGLGKLAVLLGIATLFSACNDPEGNAHGYGAVQQFPLATDPVVASGTPNTFSAAPSSEQGILFSQLGGTDWTGKSLAACVTGELTASIVQSASSMDINLCFWRTLESQYGNGLYNGTPEYYYQGDPNLGPAYGTRLKVIAHKNSALQVDHFEVSSCNYSTLNGSSPASWVQVGYILFLRTDPNSGGLSSIYERIGGFGPGFQDQLWNNFQTLTAGQLDSNNNWLGQKTMTSVPIHVSGNNSGAALTQTSNSLSVLGWAISSSSSSSSSMPGSGNTSTESVQIASSFHLLGNSLWTYAEAEGAGNLLRNSPSTTGVFGWDGEELQPVSDPSTNPLTEPFYNLVVNQSLPAIPPVDQNTEAFTGSQAWDCSLPSNYTVIPNAIPGSESCTGNGSGVSSGYASGQSSGSPICGQADAD